MRSRGSHGSSHCEFPAAYQKQKAPAFAGAFLFRKDNLLEAETDRYAVGSWKLEASTGSTWEK